MYPGLRLATMISPTIPDPNSQIGVGKGTAANEAEIDVVPAPAPAPAMCEANSAVASGFKLEGTA